MTAPSCTYLVPVPMPLPGYAQLIYRPCGQQPARLVAGKWVCREHEAAA